VFNDTEQNLESYFKNASDMHCSLPAREVSKFVFEYAVVLNKKVPEGWTEMKMAGAE
jgi:hypothetical protein